MTSFAEPVVAWRGSTDPGSPLVVLLHGRGSNEADIIGRPLDPAVRLREFVDLARIADEAGLEVFGVGEHHPLDFAIASPPVVLAADAQATPSIEPLASEVLPVVRLEASASSKQVA